MDPSWGWMAVIDRLTNGDITKQEEVFKLKYIHCMVYLLYLKDKDKYMNDMRKHEENKNKIKR